LLIISSLPSQLTKAVTDQSVHESSTNKNVPYQLSSKTIVLIPELLTIVRGVLSPVNVAITD
jgi:hypothetical protein